MRCRFSYIKKLLATFLLLLLFPLFSEADTVFLKNGMKFTSDKVWEENGEIKCYLNGLVVGFPKEDVTRIDKAPSESVEISAPVTGDIPEYDLDARKKDLYQKKKALDLEYQALMQAVEGLDPENKYRTSGIEPDRQNERILRHNKKVKEYERRKKAFDMEVGAYRRQVEKENLKQLIDEKNFLEMIKKWLKHPVDDFIAQWGYPDQIINISHGNKRYLFVVRITPELARQIIFDINRSGDIVTFKMQNGKSNPGSGK